MTRANRKDILSSPKGDDVPCIMDSSALVAYLEGKPGGKVVQRIMEQTLGCGGKVRITAFDMLSVYAHGAKNPMVPFPELLALLDQLPLKVEHVTKQMALDASSLLTEHKDMDPNTAVSLGLAKTLDGVFITAVPNSWAQKPLPASQIIYVGEENPAS